MTKTNVKSILLSCFSVIAVCAYPCFFMYFQNADEAKLGDIGVILSVFVAIGLAVWGITLLFFKCAHKSALFTNIVMLIALNYMLIMQALQKLLPWFDSKFLLPLCFVIFLTVFFILKKKTISEKASLLVAIIFGALILVNALTALPILMRKATGQPNAQITGDTNTSAVASSDSYPNIYYLLFDEYGGPQNLAYYCDYDNSAFYKQLEAKGFHTSSTSYNPESLSTTVLYPNLLNLDYVVTNEMDAFTRKEYLKNPQLYQILKQYGYNISATYFPCDMDALSVGADFVTPSSIDSRVLSEKLFYRILEKTVFLMPYTAFSNPVATQMENRRAETLNMLDTYKNITQLTETSDKPFLFLGYFETPHGVFVFDENGGSVSANDRFGTLIPSYVNQLRFINTQIDEMMDTILANDPNAIIIMQSDHGYRYRLLVDTVDDTQMAYYGDELPYMQNILNCVYYQGEPFEIEGLSGINTLRLVLNRLFSLNYSVLPQ